MRANLPAIAAGASVTLITADETGSWLDLTSYVDDLLSPAARPGARSDYTHKLEMGVTGTVGPFAALSPKTWLHAVRLAGTIDWIATGLPRAGDEVPKGERAFLDNVGGYSMSLGVVLPIAPVP